MHVAPKDGYYVWTIDENFFPQEWRWIRIHDDSIHDEAKAYVLATVYSTHHTVAVLRDKTGTITYAAFVFGNRVWHTLESHNHE